MFAMSHLPPPVNGGLGLGVMDGSGTINPAALNAPGAASANPSNIPQPSPRGVKRSRSPDTHGEPAGEHPEENESRPKKRGRPPKTRIPESPVTASQPLPPSIQASVQTPQLQNQPLPQASPTQASPTKSTPTKGTVLKALPTVRDHTTDQLNPEKDEYIPREFDEAGEKKIAANGAPLEGREYKCRTFLVPKRGEKLFMLATECARVLGYRDSYLLFNKNRSLYKIIANQEEKDELIQQEILPYSYRSRQIAIVTARSMFRQFGSRLIQNGRRVRDDYWEAKARKQGFTEEDAAGEKRPGAAKQREAAAAAEANNAALAALPHGEIIYTNGPGDSLSAVSLPMINLAPTDDLRQRDYSNVHRPRHEISGPAYQDRTQASSAAEIISQASNTAEFNKSITQQRGQRASWIQDAWRRPHDSQSPIVQAAQEPDAAPSSSQAFQSPQMTTTGVPPGQQNMLPPSQQAQGQLISSQAYAQQPHQQIPQSPSRALHQIPGHQMAQRSPGVTGAHPQPGSYAYAQNPMWQQAQPSPIQQAPSGYQYPTPMGQPSPHLQSPMNPPPQLHHQSSGSSIHGTPLGYPPMANINPGGYLPRNMYNPAPSPQQYMQSTAASQPGMPGWAPGPQQHGQWQGYQ